MVKVCLFVYEGSSLLVGIYLKVNLVLRSSRDYMDNILHTSLRFYYYLNNILCVLLKIIRITYYVLNYYYVKINMND